MIEGLLPGNQGHELALTVLCVPCSALPSGMRRGIDRENMAKILEFVSAPAFQRKENNLKRLQGFSLKIKAKIWP